MLEKIDRAIEVVKARMPAMTVHSDMQKAAQAVLNLAMARSIYAGFSKPSDGMDEELGFALGRVRSNLGGTELQQVTQAVLHLMHAKDAITSTVPAKQAKTKQRKPIESEVKPDDPNNT